MFMVGFYYLLEMQARRGTELMVLYGPAGSENYLKIRVCSVGRALRTANKMIITVVHFWKGPTGVKNSII